MAIRLPGPPPSDEVRHFYARLGVAVTAWAQVETNLFRLFLCALQAKDWATPSAVYHVATSFRTKLSMVDAACQIRFAGEPFLKTWASMFARLDRLAPKRNLLVHSPVVGAPMEELGRRMWLSANWDNSRVHPIVTGKERRRIYVDEIIVFEMGFRSAANDLCDLTESLETDYGIEPPAASMRLVHRPRRKRTPNG